MNHVIEYTSVSLTRRTISSATWRKPEKSSITTNDAIFFSHLFSLIHSRQFRAFNCILEHSLKWIDFLHVLRLALITNHLVWNLLIYFSFPVHFSFTVKQKALIMPLDLCSRCFFFSLSFVCVFVWRCCWCSIPLGRWDIHRLFNPFRISWHFLWLRFGFAYKLKWNSLLVVLLNQYFIQLNKLKSHIIIVYIYIFEMNTEANQIETDKSRSKTSVCVLHFSRHI